MMLYSNRPLGALPYSLCVPSKNALALAAAVILISACSGSGSSSDPTDPGETPVPPIGEPPTGEPPIDVPITPDQGFTIGEFPTTSTVVEGGEELDIEVSVLRAANFQNDITLQIEPTFLSDNPQLGFTFEPATLGADVGSTNVSFSYSLSVGPMQATTLEVPIQAVSGDITEQTNLTLIVNPTPAPDVYLLIGQSNMTGDSEPGSLQNLPGQPDAPDPRINQLNVTNNDLNTFPDLASFSNAANNSGNPGIITAADPLHELLPDGQATKTGNQIGPGLSFAKAALLNTTSNILLVPAAWAGTGFCNTPGNLTGWNAQARENDRMQGTGLFLRAVARTNTALQETGGVLRGILWHQGESDEFNAVCANAYAENLQSLVSALRTDIIEDGRGNAARGPDSDVPFILGTLSRGSDNRGDFSIQTPEQQAIDNAHRAVQSIVPNSSAFVDAQDLVPPAFPCGDDSCIHFGAAAYRELGSRYNQALSDILAR